MRWIYGASSATLAPSAGSGGDTPSSYRGEPCRTSGSPSPTPTSCRRPARPRRGADPAGGLGPAQVQREDHRPLNLVPAGSYYVDGRPLTGVRDAHVEASITMGTNSAAEKAAFIAEAGELLSDLLGPLPRSGVALHELPPRELRLQRGDPIRLLPPGRGPIGDFRRRGAPASPGRRRPARGAGCGGAWRAGRPCRRCW